MPKVPEGAKRPDDHSKTAAQIEAEGGEKVEIHWRDKTFEILLDTDDWDVEHTIAFEEGKTLVGIRGVLGPNQFGQFLADKPKNRDARELFDKIAKAAGLGNAGE